MNTYTRIDPDYISETHDVGSSSAQSGVITTGSGLIRICTKERPNVLVYIAL